MTAVMWENPANALPYGQQALSLAHAMHDKELEARSLFALGWIHLLTADYEASMRSVRAAIHVYELLKNDSAPTVGLSLPSFVTGAPLTQCLTNGAAEAMCWAQLSFAQLQAGQLSKSIESGYKSLERALAARNVWVQMPVPLTSGL